MGAHRLAIKKHFKNQMEKPGEGGKSNVIYHTGDQGRVVLASGESSTVQMGDPHNHNQGKVEAKVETMNVNNGNGIVGTNNDNRKIVASDDKNRKKKEEKEEDDDEENLNCCLNLR